MGLMDRISQIRDKMSQVGSNMKHLDKLTVTAPIANSVGSRFALQFHISSMRQIRGQACSTKQYLKVGAQVTKIFLQVGCNFDGPSTLPKQCLVKQKPSLLAQTYRAMFDERKRHKQELRKKRTFLLSGMKTGSEQELFEGKTYQSAGPKKPSLS